VRQTGGVSSISGPLHVRGVLASEHTLLRELRLMSLASDPGAFGSTYAREHAQTQEWWEQWAAQSQDGTTERTFVLLEDEDRWLGLALVRIDDRRPAAAAAVGCCARHAPRGRSSAGFTS
jgi:hypothetical protein